MQVFKGLLLTLISAAAAVYVDEAYRVDFHKALLGLPLAPSTIFHQPSSTSKASLIYTLTDRNVVGAVNPKDGAIIWRQPLSSNSSSPAGVLRAAEAQETVVSGLGHTVTAWGAADGKLVWSRTFENEIVEDVGIAEAPTTRDGQEIRDVLVLLRGASDRVVRLDGHTGRGIWKYRDESSDVMHKLSISTDKVHTIALHSTMMKGFKIAITTLDFDTGKKLDHSQLSSESEVSSEHDILFVGPKQNLPIIVWTDRARKTVKINSIGSKHISTFDTKNGDSSAEDIRVIAPSSSTSEPHFLLHYSTAASYWAQVLHLDAKKGTISKAYEPTKEAGSAAFSISSVGNALYITKITGEQLSIMSSSAENPVEKWPLKNMAVQESFESIQPLHSTSEVVPRSDSGYAVRSAVLLASGDWILIRNGEHVWSRPESLSGIVRAEWAELLEKGHLSQQLKEEGNKNIISAYIARSTRHIHQLPKLPTKIQWLAQRIVQTIFPFAIDIEQEPRVDLSVDTSKVIIAATKNNRFIGLDVSKSGKILWNVHAPDNSLFYQPNVELLEKAGLGGFELNWDASRQESSDSGLTPTGLQKIRYRVEDGILYGYKGDDVQLWKFVPVQGAKVVKISSILPGEPVASIGKALGDRSVLYKYLNPNAILVLAANDAQRKASIHILDSVSGEVVYSTHFTDVDISRPMSTAISENWFAFSFVADPAQEQSSRGYELLMAEMYESDIPNDRGVLGTATNYSMLRPNTRVTKPHVISKVFHISEEISHMAVTQTSQGITSRQLIVSLSGSNAIVGIPSYVLDPRRVVGKDPTTSQLEEGLSRYSPMVEFDPRWVLNHRQEVIGIQEIITTPASFESTSLIFAFGLDVFGTRVFPSFAFDILGNSFNKLQLVVTVAALLVGVAFVGPIINRKQTNILWQSI